MHFEFKVLALPSNGSVELSDVSMCCAEANWPKIDIQSLPSDREQQVKNNLCPPYSLCPHLNSLSASPLPKKQLTPDIKALLGQTEGTRRIWFVVFILRQWEAWNMKCFDFDEGMMLWCSRHFIDWSNVIDEKKDSRLVQAFTYL